MSHPGAVLSLMLVVVAMAVIINPASAVGMGDRAPGFDLPRIKGGSRVELESHRGKVVYVDFWASWCVPCRRSFPALDKLRQQNEASGFEVLAINVDENTANAERFLIAYPVHFPIGLDPAGSVPERYDIGGMPAGFLLDRQGIVRYVHLGFREGDENRIGAIIRRLLQEGISEGESAFCADC